MSKGTRATSGSKAKRFKRNVVDAIAHIHASFNNTIINISDRQGNTLTWASSGSCGFKGNRKGTPFAAQMVAERVGQRALEMGVQHLDVRVSGPGNGRESSIRTLHVVGLKISSITDVSGMPHNGCRAPKKRRA
ncbi:MAG: 30S ribosomal protein S11 [Gammaproteobacteria bacterium AqS3]|nr:30S ribosomal protein S11 [Gammaproteobacteria bacterium AqS3]